MVSSFSVFFLCGQTDKHTHTDSLVAADAAFWTVGWRRHTPYESATVKASVVARYGTDMRAGSYKAEVKQIEVSKCGAAHYTTATEEYWGLHGQITEQTSGYWQDGRWEATAGTQIKVQLLCTYRVNIKSRSLRRLVIFQQYMKIFA